jgi:hypothetical protein
LIAANIFTRAWCRVEFLLFDEYAFAPSRGEKDAVDEFFDDKPESPITLPTGQAFILKVPSKEDKKAR